MFRLLQQEKQPYLQKAYLAGITLKQFKKFCETNAAKNLSQEVYEVLLEEDERPKLDFYLQSNHDFDALNQAIIAKGNKNDVVALFITHESNGSTTLNCSRTRQYAETLFSSDAYFIPVIKRFELPWDLLRCLIKKGNDHLLLWYFGEGLHHLNEYEEGVFFYTEGNDQAKKYYVTHSSSLYETARLYAFRTQDMDTCLGIIDGYGPFSESECIAIFNRHQEKLVNALVEKLNHCKNQAGRVYKKNLPPECEVMLVQSDYAQAILAYLSGRKLCDQAEEALMITKKAPYIRQYLNEGRLGKEGLCSMAAELVLKLQKEEISLFYQKFGWPYTKEKKIIESCDHNDIKDYVAEHPLHPMNAAALLTSNSAENAIFYIDRYYSSLPKIAIVALMKRGKPKVQHYYVQLAIKNKQLLPKEAEKYFMANGNQDDILQYIQTCVTQCLWASSVVELLNRKNSELTDAYFAKFGFADCDLTLFAQEGKFQALQTFFDAGYKLPPDGEIALIQRAEKNTKEGTLLTYYFFCFDLSPQGEIELLKTKHVEDHVSLYLRKFDLYEKSETFMITEKQMSRIKLYTEYHPLCAEACNLYAAIY